jgi:hypothetical protein
MREKVEHKERERSRVAGEQETPAEILSEAPPGAQSKDPL